MGYYDDQRRQMVQQNRDADARAAANNQARRDASHKDFMQTQERIGQQMRDRNTAFSESLRATSRNSGDTAGYSGGGSPGRSKGGGLAFVVIVIGAIAVFGHSGSSKSGSTTSTPVASNTGNAGPSRYSSSIPVPATPAISSADRTPPAATSPNDTASPVANTTASDTTSTSDTPTPATTTAPATPEPTDPVAAAGSPDALPTLEPVYRIGAAYPAAAMQARPSGPVVIRIGAQPNGTVSEAVPMSGDPLLVPAAIAAARQWTFKPYAYEPGKPVRTYRVAFDFTPPVANGLRPYQPGHGSYPQQPGHGFGYQPSGRGFGQR